MNVLLSPALSWLLSYLFNALWQIPLIFAAAWIAARVLHPADLGSDLGADPCVNPGLEHRIWVGALWLQLILPACNLQVASLWHTLLNLLPSTGTVSNGGVHILLGSAATAGVSTLRLPLVLEAGLVLAWACCTLYFAARLTWGLFQTHILARTATRLTLIGESASRWTGHCHRMEIATPPPEIAASPQGIGPVTIGLRRGLVLLPPAFLESMSPHIAPNDLEAVLAHELAHIQRHDFAKNLLYGLVSLPIAWHPVVWRTRARVAESRELVCDAMAADSIAAEAAAGRRQYAQSLLRLASMLSAGSRVAAVHALGILSLNTDARIFERRIMTLTHKRTPMSAMRRILGAAACCVVALATCASALALHTDVSALTPSAENQASAPAAPTKIHVKSSIMVRQRISGDNPTYPKELRAKKIQGTVVLDAAIGKDGTIENIRVVKSPDKQFSESALAAVRTWRYRPYLLNGDPIKVDTTVNVIYCLADCHFPADSQD
jgi:TonB family protein